MKPRLVTLEIMAEDFVTEEEEITKFFYDMDHGDFYVSDVIVGEK